jgi:hypothetical protein
MIRELRPLRGAQHGLASQRCDYTSMFGTLKFAANETQKTIDIPINLDAYTEGPETFTVKLSNPTGGAVLALPSTATVTISDSASPAPNAIDDTTTFVRQQYRDFLNREADAAGLAFWKDNIDKCNDASQRPPGQTRLHASRCSGSRLPQRSSCRLNSKARADWCVTSMWRRSTVR